MGAHAERLRKKVLKEPPEIRTEAAFYNAMEQILQHTTLSGFQVVGILEHFAARTNLQIITMQQGEDERLAKAQAEDEAAKAQERERAKQEFGAKHV